MVATHHVALERLSWPAIVRTLDPPNLPRDGVQTSHPNPVTVETGVSSAGIPSAHRAGCRVYTQYVHRFADYDGVKRMHKRPLVIRSFFCKDVEPPAL